jgi:AraC family transcriptional regulator, ethanolamine operon transcriptional activator
MVTPSIGFPQSMKNRQSHVRLPQPNVTVAEIWDPATAEEDIEVIHQNLVQLRSEPLRARRVVVRLDSTVLIYQSTNLAVRARTKLTPGLRAVVAFGPQALGTVNGLLIHPDRLLMAVGDAECQFVVERGYESITIALPPTNFEAHLTNRQLRDPLQPHRAVDLFVCDATKAREFFSFGKRLAVTAARQPDLFDGRKEVCAATENEFVELLLEAIGSSEDYAATRSDKTYQTYSHVIEMAEDWALVQTDGPFYVTDLCRGIGVSERTLEYAFKEILNMSPVAFLRRARLHCVRQALRAESRRTTTVSAVALKWGFWHFGDFSRAYKDCFGELPSDTLRREPGQL